MILKALYDLAQREELVPDPNFEIKPVSWVIRVGDGGRFLGIVPLKQAEKIPEKDWDKNAHTRRPFDKTDIVIFAKSGLSGRLERCIPIGEYRDKAYRVTREILEDWGG
ncbi:MAG: hypothetical protein KKH85_05395, partial [Proteobacteria bacterium]|nr:hypothetical protein [Pseudomonadota bacterium]